MADAETARTAPATTAVALTATLGLAAASWVISVGQMNAMATNAMATNAMGVGVATGFGSFSFFVALWVVMMAAMMLPGAAPEIVRRAHAGDRLRAVPLFVGSYLAVWMFVGIAVYALYRPPGDVTAGALVVAAGVYELTPLKRHFRRRCREGIHSGLQYGLTCVGSCAGLMLILVALSIMSVGWMAVVTAVVVAQRLLPVKAAVDVPLALAIVSLGILVAVAPSLVPGRMPPMTTHVHTMP